MNSVKALESRSTRVGSWPNCIELVPHSYAYLTAIGTDSDPEASSFYSSVLGPTMTAVWTLAPDDTLHATQQSKPTVNLQHPACTDRVLHTLQTTHYRSPYSGSATSTSSLTSTCTQNSTEIMAIGILRSALPFTSSAAPLTKLHIRRL